MISVEMANDIRRFDTKTTSFFTTRQLKAMGIGIVIGAFISFFLSGDITKLVTLAVCALAMFSLSVVKINNVNFEIIFLRILYLYVFTPPRRKYITTNLWMEELEKINKAEEAHKLAKMTPKERKAYAKKTVKYSYKKEYKVYR